MTDHEFGVSVMQWLLIVMAVLGIAYVLERIFEGRPRRNRYRMPLDGEDDKRRIEDNGRKAQIGRVSR